MVNKPSSYLLSLQKKLKQQQLKITALETENTQLKTKLEACNTSEVAPTLKDIIAIMPGNIYWKGSNGKYLGCNNNIVKMCNLLSPDEIIGKRLIDLYNQDIADQVEEIDNKVISSGEVYICEERGLNAQNQPAIFLSEKIPLRNKAGTIIGLLGVSFDITERKKMEEDLIIAKEKAEASNYAKSQFLAVMNHELRTPLASITSLLNFLKQKNLPVAEEQNLIKSIEDCSTHLLSLVDDVLNFSRLETDQYQLKITSIYPESILQEVYNMLRPLAENKNLNFNLCLEGNPCSIFTDARLLRQILINIVTNAVKFTEVGSVDITANFHTVSKNKTNMTIIVTDTGIGIPHDKLDLIFEPFQQLEDAYTRQSSRSGTGLGLAIVKKLANLIAAKITVSSEPRMGTSFTFEGEFKIDATPPIKKITTAKKSDKPKEALKPIYPHTISKQPFILLVEDDPIVQFIHQKMLSDLGCRVEIAEKGKEALVQLNKHDVVFVDISLPDISGFDVIKQIRQEKKRKVPIIALTVYNGKEEKQACLKAGANEFKNKPISQLSLKKLLLRYL